MVLYAVHVRDSPGEYLPTFTGIVFCLGIYFFPFIHPGGTGLAMFCFGTGGIGTLGNLLFPLLALHMHICS